MALGLAHDASLGGDMEVHLSPATLHELGRAAADVDDDDRRLVLGVALAGRAEEGETGLLVAGEDLGAQPVVVGHLVDERGAVGGVAHRAGEDGDVALGLLGVEALAVLRERRADAVHRLVGQAAGGVDALAQAGDDAVAVEDGHAVGGELGDEQARGVASDVDDADPHATAWGIGSPARPARRFSTASSAMRARVEWVAEPMWGTTRRLGAASSGWSAGSGSGSVTSRAAPAMVPVCS